MTTTTTTDAIATASAATLARDAGYTPHRCTRCGSSTGGWSAQGDQLDRTCAEWQCCACGSRQTRTRRTILRAMARKDW